MNSRVSDIFKAAGEAFNRLGEMTMQLHNQNESTKWSEEDVDMLQSAITTFGQDLNKISVRIKDRTASQIRQTLTKQVFEEAGIRVQQVTPATPPQQVKMTTNQNNGATTPQIIPTEEGHLMDPEAASPNSSAEVMMMTLNRLNAPEDEDHLNSDFVEEEVVSG